MADTLFSVKQLHRGSQVGASPPEELTIYPGGPPVATHCRLAKGKPYEIVLRDCISVELLHRQGRIVFCDGLHLVDELGGYWPLVFDEGLHLNGQSLIDCACCTLIDEDREKHVYRLLIHGTGSRLRVSFNLSPARWAVGALTLSLSERFSNRAARRSSK